MTNITSEITTRKKCKQKKKRKMPRLIVGNYQRQKKGRTERKNYLFYLKQLPKGQKSDIAWQYIQSCFPILN